MNYNPLYNPFFDQRHDPYSNLPSYNTYYYQNPFFDSGIYDERIKKEYTKEEALAIGEALGLDFNETSFDIEQFRMGLDVELEHGTICQQTNVTYDNSLLTGKIALVHLYEFPDYYTRLKKMEKEADSYWASKNYQNPCF